MWCGQRLNIDNHLAAIVEPIVIIHNIRLLIVKPDVRQGEPAISNPTPIDHGNSIGMAWIARRRPITHISKCSLAVQISTEADDTLSGEDTKHVSLMVGEF